LLEGGFEAIGWRVRIVDPENAWALDYSRAELFISDDVDNLVLFFLSDATAQRVLIVNPEEEVEEGIADFLLVGPLDPDDPLGFTHTGQSW
jgi:hypothetical protein